jgi:orotate phosphoribosyltransferase
MEFYRFFLSVCGRELLGRTTQKSRKALYFKPFQGGLFSKPFMPRGCCEAGKLGFPRRSAGPLGRRPKAERGGIFFELKGGFDVSLKPYQKEFARFLAETGCLFFKKGLVLKDGRPSPYFVNMGRLNTGKLSFRLGSFFAALLVESGRLSEVDIILGPSYKGSAIAQAAAINLWTSNQKELYFDYDRKEVKNYGEASGQKNLMVNNTFFDGCGLWIVDDVGTSMATKYELLEKIAREAERRRISIHIVGLSLGIDRQQTTACYDAQGKVLLGERGEDALRLFKERTGVPVYSLATISEAVNYLCEEQIPVQVDGAWQLISAPLKKEFDEYLQLYGTINKSLD